MQLAAAIQPCVAPHGVARAPGRPVLLPRRPTSRGEVADGNRPTTARDVRTAATAPQRSPLPAAAPSKLTFSVLFSDLDGTCVHYNSPLGRGRDGKPAEILQLPPSKTGTHGVISVRTLQVGCPPRRVGLRLVTSFGDRTTNL